MLWAVDKVDSWADLQDIEMDIYQWCRGSLIHRIEQWLRSAVGMLLDLIT
jgi:hypothetical protein